MEKINAIICLKKKKQPKRVSKNYREAKISQCNNE